MSKTKKLNVFKLILKERKTMTMKQLMKIFFSLPRGAILYLFSLGLRQGDQTAEMPYYGL